MDIIDHLMDEGISGAIKLLEYDSAKGFLRDFFIFVRNDEEIKESGFLSEILDIIGEGMRHLRYSICEEIEVHLTLVKIAKLIKEES